MNKEVACEILNISIYELNTFTLKIDDIAFYLKKIWNNKICIVNLYHI